MTKQLQTGRTMLDPADSNRDDEDVPIVYSISIEALTTTKRSLTCSIVTESTRTSNPLPSAKKDDCPVKSAENVRRTSIHLPVTYSTSIHIPCRPPVVQPRLSTISSSQSSRHHYHHYHHYHHHHHYHQPPPMSAQPSTSIKPKPLSKDRSNSSTELTTTDTSPHSLPTSKKSHKTIHSSRPISTLESFNKKLLRDSAPPTSALLWSWVYSTSRKLPSHYKAGQSEYSEVCRHESPSKRSLLFKLLTSPVEKTSKANRHRSCFARQCLDSSSSSFSPNHHAHYNE